MKQKFYRTIISVLMAVIVLICFSACGGNDPQDDNTGKEPSNTESEQTSSNKETNDSTSPENIQLQGTYKVPMENIYVDVPQFQEIEEGLTEVFIERGIKYVAITANWKAEASSLEDAHEKCFEKFADNMANYQGGINSISITNSQKKTINGVEMIRFEGKINYGTDTKMDGYAVGYTFIMDNIPCEIIGSVIENDQSSAAINEITSIVDAMSLTVRNAE